MTQAQISVGHGYHGVSLLRKYLGVGFENCVIRAWEFANPIVEGPGRAGYPEKEQIIQDRQQFACLILAANGACLILRKNSIFQKSGAAEC